MKVVGREILTHQKSFFASPLCQWVGGKPPNRQRDAGYNSEEEISAARGRTGSIEIQIKRGDLKIR